MILFLVFVRSCEKNDNDSLSSNSIVVFNPDINYGTMTDQDGNVYKTVTIGAQTWMAENLFTTKFNDGTAIPNVIDDDEWAVQTTGAYCTYNNTSNADTILAYGCLYNWYAVNTGLLAPEGWHVPTDAEWTTLTDYLGGEDVAGAKLKETGITHWNRPNELETTNETGFTAFPGGYRNFIGGTFNYFGDWGCWWSSSQSGTNSAWCRSVIYYQSNVEKFFNHKTVGFSVRCVKD